MGDGGDGGATPAGRWVAASADRVAAGSICHMLTPDVHTIDDNIVETVVSEMALHQHYRTTTLAERYAEIADAEVPPANVFGKRLAARGDVEPTRPYVDGALLRCWRRTR